MRIEIHDVGHGMCAVITCPNRERLMFDCSYGLDPAFFPHMRYWRERFALVAIGNLDEDHVRGLPDLWEGRNTINGFFSNPTVTFAALERMKDETGGMRSGVKHVAGILRERGAGLVGWVPDLGGVRVRAYWNRYGTDFTQTNNLSCVYVVEWNGFKILFGSDMETAGWRQLLKNPSFRADLATVAVFVASHHGRESGRCSELFDYCRPRVFIFSDDAVEFETQKTAGWYGDRASGIVVQNATPGAFGAPPLRKVYTTRSDGTLQIDVPEFRRFVVTPIPSERAPVLLTFTGLLNPSTGTLGTNALSSYSTAHPAPRGLSTLAGNGLIPGFGYGVPRGLI